MTDNFGFLPSPYANINLIRDNLHDRYRDVYAIVKELVQNADDAEATRLDIAWTRGLAGVDHVLLRGPALVVVNNGPFDDRNDRAIRQLGLSDRANQKATIGKFGLGLKSIFHLCEAFFYLASDQSGAMGGNPVFARVFNPWSGGYHTDIHQDWNQFASSDQTRLIAHLQGFLDTPHWFCMWVPLRSKAHMGGYDAISPEWPGDDARPPAAIFTPDVGIQLANILPMLQSLREIRSWTWHEDRKEFGRLFAARLDDGAARRHDVANGQPGLWPLGGRLVVESESSGTPRQAVRIPYAGEEALLDAPSFRELQSDQAWPRYTVIDETGKPLIAPEKAQPHGAVYFTLAPARGVGALRRSNAVFLPVGDSQQTGSYSGQRDILLTLHGYYFVDAGRSRLAGNPLADESAVAAPEVEADPASLTIQSRWNRRLTDEAVLLLVLPALSHFVEEANLSAGQTRSMTAALMHSRLYRHHRAAICSRQQWVSCYSDEDMRPVWRLIAVDVPIYELPSPPESEPDRPFEVMPALRPICKTHAVTVSSQSLARLTRDAASPWPAPLLRQMLDLPVSTVFRSQGQLEYLAAFLDAQTEQGDASASHVIGRLVEGLVFIAMREVGIAELRKNRTLVQRIVRHVPAERRYAIGSIESTHPDLLQSLVRLAPTVLLLPKEFNPSNTPAAGVLAERDAEQLLAHVATTLAERRDDAEWAEACEQIAVQTLDALEGKKAQFLARCDHYAVFTGYRCATAAERALSLRELREARGRHTLFTYTAGGSKFGLAVELQQALHSGDVVVIRRDVADCLFGIGVLSFCNEESCIRALAAGPLLADVTGRAALLDRLQGRLDETHISIDLKMGLRYLLHGQTAHAGHDDTLFVDSDDSAAWGRLAALALHQHDESWRVMPRHLLSYLKPRYLPLLNIRPMTAFTVSEVLASCDLSVLSCAEFSVVEREAFLLGIENTAVLKALRIHEALDGTLVAITDCTYLQDGFDLPPDLASAVTIVRPSGTLEVLMRQKQLVQPLNAGAAVKIALDQPEPHLYWRMILQALAKMRVPPAEALLGKRLRETPWLPTIHGTPVCPNDVIDLAGVEDEIARVVSLTKGAFVTIHTLSQDVLNHDSYRVLQDVIPPPTQAVELLAMIMAEDSRYHVGLAPSEDVDFDDFLDVFAGASDGVMPACPLLRALHERTKRPDTDHGGTATDDDVLNLWSALRQDLSAERLVDTLGYLRSAHQSTSGQRQKAALRVHNWYLHEVRVHTPSTILPHIELLSRQGAWASTSTLCYADEAGNVAARYVLDKEQESCLGQRSVWAQGVETAASIRVDQPSLDMIEPAPYTPHDIGQAASLLADYFRDWAGSVPDEIIGAFLSLLGDDEHILELADRYLDTGQRTVRNTREMLDWEPITATTAMGGKIGGFGEDIHDVMAKQRVVVRVEDAASDQVEVINLLGRPFLAHLADQLEAESLLVGARGKSLPGGAYRVRLLHLRHIAVEAATPQRLVSLLRETAARVLRDWYLQEPANLDDVWEALGQTGQLDIEIARGMLLHSAFGYLRQLGLRDNQRIGRVLSEWENALKRKIEEEQAEQARKTAIPIRKTAEKDMLAAREHLAELLEDDAEAQALVLGEVRTKIRGHYQYALRSIPFELFQNADDAVVELGELLPEGSDDSARTALRRRTRRAWAHLCPLGTCDQPAQRRWPQPCRSRVRSRLAQYARVVIVQQRR